jgi:hypothetical protein
LHKVEPVGNVPGVAVKVKNDRAVLFAREKPSVQKFAVLGVEKGFFVLKAKLLGMEIKVGLGKVNEETLDPGIEKIRADGKDQDENNQISPVDRHQQHLPERIYFSHGPIIADPFPAAKSKNPVLIEPGTGGVVS